MSPRKSDRSQHRNTKPTRKPSQNTSRRKSDRGADDPLIEVKLKGMANGGLALGTSQRRTVFVPYAIPGERLKARIVRSERNVDFAEGVQLIDASADRVFPQCPHFGPGQCWGCQWQHINYESQLLLKQDVLADQLQRMGHFDDATLERAMRPVIGAPQQWQYNMQIVLDRDEYGRFGLPRADGRTIEPIEECHILHEDLQALYESLDMDFADVRRLTLLRGSDGATMLIMTMTSEDAPQLSADIPASVNLILPDNEPVNLVGDSVLWYEIGGRSLRVTAGSFFRANVEQTERLVGQVLELLQPGENDAILDLYAGVGLYSPFVAARAGLVTLVESYPPAVTDADENLAEFDNVDVIEGTVEDVLASLVDAGAIYEAAIVDPPSSGLSKKAREHLLSLEVPRIVYVSSSPATLARDSQQLCRAGYRLKVVQPLDFAPQTYYIDTVALLERH